VVEAYSGIKTVHATFWTNENHWQWATKPNVRERASFLKENLMPMQESGQLKFIARGDDTFVKSSELGFGILFVDGHTEKQMIPHIQYQGRTIAYVADLVPTVGHIPVPYITGYDTRPLVSLTEKELFLNTAEKEDYILFLEHDAHNEICTLQSTERGVRLNQAHTFNDLFK